MSTVAESPLTINPSMPVADARAVCKKAVEAGYCSQESADEALETYFAARAQNVGISASRSQTSNGAGKPYLRKDGQVHGDKDPRAYRLCRRDSAKQGPGYYDRVTFMVLRCPKGEHISPNVNLDIPVLEALVTKHGVGGVFKAALDDYKAGTICYSRERD
jgi:hypothetical protein